MIRPDSIVVGGGVVGLAVACELAREGQSVMVLERGQIGVGASGVAGGLVSQQLQPPGPLLNLVRESIKRYYVAADWLGADLGLRSCGSLMLARDETEAAVLRQRATVLTGVGVPVELLDGDAARQEEPVVAPGVTAALRVETDLHLDPRRLLTAYVGALQRLGGEIRENRLVVGLQRNGDRVTGVRTQYGDLDAEQVVLAAGCWTPVLLPPTHAAFVRARRGQVLVARPRRRCVQHVLLGADFWTAKAGDTSLGFLLEQTVDGVLRLGATREWAGYDTRPTARMVEVEANAGGYARLPEDVTWSYAAAGLRPATADGLPLIGQLERGLWLASGHETAGFALAPATAGRLASAMLGRPTDLRAFHPGRFMTPPERPGQTARAGLSPDAD